VYYFNLLLWHKIQHGENPLLSSVTRGGILVAAGILMLVFSLFFFAIKTQHRKTYFRTMIMIVAGFTGITLHVVLLLVFQTMFGSIYEMVGLMIALQMLGLAIGAALFTLMILRWSQNLIVSIHLALLFLFLSGLPFLLPLAFKSHSFLLISFLMAISGVWVGIIFAAVNSSFLQTSHSLGWIYAADLLGSALGALVSCSILFPLLGIKLTVWLLAGFLLILLIACRIVRI
jgi:spermidine synthase